LSVATTLIPKFPINRSLLSRLTKDFYALLSKSARTDGKMWTSRLPPLILHTQEYFIYFDNVLYCNQH